MIKLRTKDGNYLLAAGQNRGLLKIFELKKHIQHITLQPHDVSAEILFKDGRKQKQEFYYGSSFLSQSARFLCIGDNVESAVVADNMGKTRKLSF